MSAVRPLVDEATAAFIQGGVSIIAASTDEANLPKIARAVGCRVSPDRHRLTILVPQADPLVEAVRTRGKIAVTFTEPSSHRTIQIKGEGAEIAALHAGDARLTKEYVEAFMADVCPLGYAQDLIAAMVTYDPSELTAVEFQPKSKFLQTPGPRAGTCLDSTSGC